MDTLPSVQSTDSPDLEPFPDYLLGCIGLLGLNG